MAIKEKLKQLSDYDAKTIHLSYGDMSYVDKGNGEVILSVHGIFGGYDQAFDSCKDFASEHRILAPSRFGYLDSDILGSGTPAGPPAFLCNDYAMFLMNPLFEPVMGMDSSTIYGMLPVGERKAGVILDASITNPDMARNYDSYIIEDLQIPTLILHAKDDKLASYEDVEKALNRFPNCTFVSFEMGWHLMAGHEAEVKKAVMEFIKGNAD